MTNKIKTMYCVATKNNGAVDVSSSLRGAKNYASRHGYSIVCRRSRGGSLAIPLAEKVGNKWIDIK